MEKLTSESTKLSAEQLKTRGEVIEKLGLKGQAFRLQDVLSIVKAWALERGGTIALQTEDEVNALELLIKELAENQGVDADADSLSLSAIRRKLQKKTGLKEIILETKANGIPLIDIKNFEMAILKRAKESGKVRNSAEVVQHAVTITMRGSAPRGGTTKSD